MASETYSYLALGDSYTIGEAVPLHESFPYQTVQMLRHKGFKFHAPEIIAQTGWTTDELTERISNTVLMPSYDFVSLLIGVNNQYRGKDIEIYKKELEALLQIAIAFANDDCDKVFVLSIPDWGITPFAEGRDRNKISNEIDTYNNIGKQMAESYRVHFMDITGFTREASTDSTLLATDKLHPSGKDYSRWAEKLSKKILEVCTNEAAIK